MTTNLTIDGVPRDSVLLLVEFLADARAYHKVVIERCNDCVKSGESSEREEYGRIGYRTEKVEQVERLSEELRALLDAPAVQCREVDGEHCPNPECCAWIAPNSQCRQCKTAAQPQGEPVGYTSAGMLELSKLMHAEHGDSRIGVRTRRSDTA